MKVHVITDDKGNVVATVQGVPASHGDIPASKPAPLAGQHLHEVELPAELEGNRDPKRLHEELKRLLA